MDNSIYTNQQQSSALTSEDFRQKAEIHMIRFMENRVRNHMPLMRRSGMGHLQDFSAIAKFEHYFGMDGYKKCFLDTEERLGIWYNPYECPDADTSLPCNKGLEVPEHVKAYTSSVSPAPVPEIHKPVHAPAMGHTEKPAASASAPKAQTPLSAQPASVSYAVLPEKTSGKTMRIHLKLDSAGMDRMKSGAGKRRMDEPDYLRACIEAVFANCDEKKNTYLGKPFRSFIVEFLKKDRAGSSAPGDLYIRISPEANKKLKTVSQRSGIMISDFVRFCLWEVENHE